MKLTQSYMVMRTEKPKISGRKFGFHVCCVMCPDPASCM